MTIAWVFPGQGSQKIGMADSVIELPGAKDRFEFASAILGRDLLKICNGLGTSQKAIQDLNDTRNTQPAMFVVESLLVDDLRSQGRKASLFAGHSLGEIVALYAADVLKMETALRLLKCRSELMAAADDGAMTAVMGFDRNQLEDLVNLHDGVVIANDNSDSQVVLSGTPQSIEEITKQLECKRAIPLQVSGAFHSPLMSKSSIAFNKELDQVEFQDAIAPVISNSDPKPTINGLLLKERLKKQMTSGVRWRETMEVMIEEGIDTLVEIGPGKVLSGLAKRSLKGVTTNQITSASDLGH
tara:strand:+ start:3106 stop:4002 length:897 start_codon:yes stop_codon:yes gene_type:complete